MRFNPIMVKSKKTKKKRTHGTAASSLTKTKVRPMGSRTLEKEAAEVDEEEREGKEEFEKENP
jgi:hypothetical protein